MELKKEIESLLFSSGKMMKEKELAELTNSPENEVKAALEMLKKEYDERDTSLMLVQISDNWKLNVREKYINLVTKIVSDTELPFPVLETLSVIAYKSPMIQAEVIKMRGTNAYEQIGVLVDTGFIEKKKDGRSFKLNLTPKFFEYFDVQNQAAMQETFKDVKIPEKRDPEKLGNLDVVNLTPEEIKKQEEKDKNKLGELEIIDEPEQLEEKKITFADVKPDKGFLEDIEKKIDELSKKNDDNDHDTSFKRSEFEKEMQDAIGIQSNSETETGPVEVEAVDEEGSDEPDEEGDEETEEDNEQPKEK